jgi:hypothetical protein
VLSTFFFSVADSLADGTTTFGKILANVTKDVFVAVIANYVTGQSLPLSVRKRMLIEIPEAMEALNGGVIAFQLPIWVHDIQGTLKLLGFDSLHDLRNFFHF